MKTIFFAVVLFSTTLTGRATTYDITAAPYNANGSDMVDDTKAIQDAIHDAVLSGGTVYVPSGTYYVKSTLTGEGSCDIVGDGQNGSVVFLRPEEDPVTHTYPVIDLMSFSFSSASQRLQISDITFSCSHPSATALTIIYPNNLTPVNGLIANRFHIRDDFLSGGWNTGIKLVYAKNSQIRNCMVAAHASGDTFYGGSGIEIGGDSSGTSIVSTSISYFDTGIYVSSAIAGAWTVDKAIMVYVRKGLYASQSVGSLLFENSHVDTRGENITMRCLDVADSSNATIRNNLFYISLFADQGSGGRYHMTFKGTGATITGNHFNAYEYSGGVVIMNGSSNIAFTDNIVASIGEQNNVPFWIQPGVSGVSVQGNLFTRSGSGPIFDQGSSDVIANNQIVP